MSLDIPMWQPVKLAPRELDGASRFKAEVVTPRNPTFVTPEMPEIRDRALAQAPVDVAWQLGSGVDGKLFPHQRSPLQKPSGRSAAP